LCSRTLIGDNFINEKEHNIVSIVLLKYNIKSKDIIKTRSCYKIETIENEFLCIKRIKHGKNRLLNSYLLATKLADNGFHNTTKFLLTPNDEKYIRFRKYIFYMTQWIDGEECNFNNLHDAVNCTKLMAYFHQTTKKINTKDFKIKNKTKNWPKIFYKRINDIEKFNKLIEKKKLKTDFDMLYTQYSKHFISSGSFALDLIMKSDYYKLYSEALRKKTICYNNFYTGNIVCKDSNFYLTDLSGISVNLHIFELSKFIRHLLYKECYQWDFNKIKIILEAYLSVQPLTKKELEALLSFIIFPYKFCKLGKKRYFKQKNYSENRYLNKLSRILKHIDYQELFAKKYMEYFFSSALD
jgi:CotS family spore coat protein